MDAGTALAAHPSRRGEDAAPHRMRSEIYSQRFCVSKDEVTETRPAIGAPILGKNPTR
jgi:hypothetical protein